MSTIVFEIQPEKERLLEALAFKNGKDIPTLLKDMVDAVLVGTEGATPRQDTFDSLLAPFRRGFAGSGDTADDLTELLDRELRNVRAERRASQPNA